MTLRWFDGAEHSMDVSIAGTSEKSMNEGFYLPKETIEKLWGNMDLTASLTLSPLSGQCFQNFLLIIRGDRNNGNF